MEKKFDLKKFLSNNAIIILIILLALFVGCTTQNFFTETNGKNLLLNVAPRFIIACGVSGCLITKGTDLSAGRQVGLAACFSAMLLQSVDYSARMLPWLPDIPWPVALLIVMAIMACFGAINGCIIAFLKVPPFIATLGMQTIVYGLCSVITNNQPMGGYKQSYLTVASGTLGPIPFLAIFALIVGIFFWFLYNKTRHGKYMYAIGGNENAAQVAGVNVTASLIRIYILASCMYALGGFLVGAKAERHPELVRRIAAEGHDTGIHTWEHAAGFPMRSSWAMTADILRCRESLRQIAGVETHLFRPPFGVTNPMVARAVKRTQSRCIGWSVRSFDTLLRRSREAVAERIARRLGDGKVILLHDDRPGADRLLRLVLDDLKRRGYGTATVCELFKIEKP